MLCHSHSFQLLLLLNVDDVVELIIQIELSWVLLIKWKRGGSCILRVERAKWRITRRRTVRRDWFMDRCNRRRIVRNRRGRNW